LSTPFSWKNGSTTGRPQIMGSTCCRPLFPGKTGRQQVDPIFWGRPVVDPFFLEKRVDNRSTPDYGVDLLSTPFLCELGVDNGSTSFAWVSGSTYGLSGQLGRPIVDPFVQEIWVDKGSTCFEGAFRGHFLCSTHRRCHDLRSTEHCEPTCVDNP